MDAADLSWGIIIDGHGSSSWGKFTLRWWGFWVDRSITIIDAALLVLVTVEQDNVVSIKAESERDTILTSQREHIFLWTH